jgi:hypothetical protein
MAQTLSSPISKTKKRKRRKPDSFGASKRVKAGFDAFKGRSH